MNFISYITLWVFHFDASVSFYRDLPGLPVEHIEENFAQFATTGTKLYLHRLSQPQPLRTHTVEIHFQVENVDETCQQLHERGAAFVSLPANMPWGTRMAALKDPEGFAIEIVGPLDPDEPTPSCSEQT